MSRVGSPRLSLHLGRHRSCIRRQTMVLGDPLHCHRLRASRVLCPATTHRQLCSVSSDLPLPESMSAVCIESRDGRPLGSDMKAIRAAGDDVTLTLRPNQPLPQLQSDEVLIKVDYAGVNRPDIVQRKGLYPPPKGASPVLGLEVSGTVVALGAKLMATNSVIDPWGGAGPIRVGDQVCALLPGGGYAEYAPAPASSCLRVPLGFSQLEAAALPETFFTVWTNLFQSGVRGAELASEESILIHGGTSGIGTTAIQLAKAMGAKSIIATAGTDEKCEACLALGATLAVNYRTDDYVSAIKEHCNGGGVDVVLDMVGGDYLQRNLTVLNKRGRHVSIAFLNGSKSPEPFDFGKPLRFLAICCAGLEPEKWSHWGGRTSPCEQPDAHRVHAAPSTCLGEGSNCSRAAFPCLATA